MKKSKKATSKKQSETESFADEWEISSNMGILPEDIPFTQNIGCVGGKTKSSKVKSIDSTKEKNK
ncbi:hypothetical protein JYB64_20395 [Algoriphagus aestuarii]|nr:hypothetical protein [Algoriphagus aestuarii]